MKTRPHYENVPLEKYKGLWHEVDECRRLVGYQSGADWTCPYLLQGDEFRAKFGENATT